MIIILHQKYTTKPLKIQGKLYDTLPIMRGLN